MLHTGLHSAVAVGWYANARRDLQGLYFGRNFGLSHLCGLWNLWARWTVIQSVDVRFISAEDRQADSKRYLAGVPL